MSAWKKGCAGGLGCLSVLAALIFLAVAIDTLAPSTEDSEQAAAPTPRQTALPPTPTPVPPTPTPVPPLTPTPAPKVVERDITGTATLLVTATPSAFEIPTGSPELISTVQPTVNLVPPIAHSGTGPTIGQIDLPAGVYQIHFVVTNNDRRFAPDTYKLVLTSRSGGDARVTIKGSDANARHSVRYYNLRDDQLFFEIDVGEKGVWLVEIAETSEALPTPLPATPTPTLTTKPEPTDVSTKAPTITPTEEPQPTPRSAPTPVATLTPDTPREYEIQPNDTLSSIADRFGTTIDELVRANGIDDPNVIQVGDTLIIPPAQTSGDRAASPSSRPTTECPTPEQQTYFGLVAPLISRGSDSFTFITTLLESAVDDQVLVIDEGWKLSMTLTLVDLDILASEIDDLDAPRGAEELHATLDRLPPLLRDLTSNMLQGIDNLDAAALNRAVDNLNGVVGLTEILVQQTESFCDGMENPSDIQMGDTPITSPTQASKDPSTSSSPTPTATPMPHITARELSAAWDNNPIRAERDFKGRKMVVSGFVIDIDDFLGQRTVTLEGNDIFSNVDCYVDGKPDWLFELSIGQHIYVVGILGGEFLGSVSIDDCELFSGP